MATDKERYEVAQRLRELHPEDKAWWGIYGFDWYMFADSLFNAIGCSNSRNWTDYLADLIEPDHIGDSNKMVDRDALLALADEMNRSRSRCDFCIKRDECDWADETICLEKMMDDYASVIREALGV